MNAGTPPTDDSRRFENAADSSVPRAGAPLVLVAITVAVAAASGWFVWQSPVAVKVILVLLAAWHGVRRLLALTRYTRAKDEPPTFGATLLEWAVAVLWFGAAILFSPDRMDVMLFTFYGAGMPLIPAMWIQGLQLLWGLTMAAVTAVFFMHYLWRRMQGVGEGAVRLLLMASSIAVWWYAMRGVQDVLVGLMVFEVFQLAQGLAVVWRLGATEESTDAGTDVLFRHSVCWVFVYLVIFSVYGILAATGRVPSEAAIITDNLVRVVTSLAVVALMVHFVWDELLLRRLVNTALSPGTKPVPAKRLPRLGAIAGWCGFLLIAGWFVLADREPEKLSLAVYDNVVTAYPTSWRAHTRFGVELREMGELPAALEELTLAAELNPQSAAVRIELGRLLRGLNETEKAVAELREAIELNPTDPAGYAELGKTLFSLGKTDEGRKYLEAALKRRPNDPAAHVDMALAYASLRDWEQALSSFNAAIELDPEFAIAYNGRGNVLWSQGELDAALKEYAQAISIAPELAKPYRNRAGVWLDKDEIDRAIADLGKAIELDGSNGEDLIRRGDLYYSVEKYAEALEDYENAAQVDQRFTTPLVRLVTLWTSCPDKSFHDLEAATAAARTACDRTQWRSPVALQMLAGVLTARGSFDEALRWQSQAVELASGEAKDAFQKQLEVIQKLSEDAAATGPKSGS